MKSWPDSEQMISLYLQLLISAIDCPTGLKCCEPIKDPQNGHASYCKNDTACPVGTVVSFWCEPFYQLQGSPTITCQQTGGPGMADLSDLINNKPGFSSPVPMCIPSLSKKTKINNNSIH